jgi:hypothetical protein
MRMRSLHETYLLIVPHEHVFKVNFHLDVHIRASPLLRSTATTIAKKLAEHIKGVMMSSTPVPLLFVLLQPLMPIPIVNRPLVLIRKNFVRFRYRDEFLFGIWS